MSCKHTVQVFIVSIVICAGVGLGSGTETRHLHTENMMCNQTRERPLINLGFSVPDFVT